jgi:hypothetical protein
MKKLIVLIVVTAMNFSFVSAALPKGGDDTKNRLKELKERKKALRQEEKMLDQKLKIKKLEKQANNHAKRNKHKQVEIDHQ